MRRKFTLLFSLFLGTLTWLQVNAQIVFRVTSPESLAGSYPNSHPADWGGRVTSPLTLEAVLVNDGSANPTLGCEASPAGAYDGKAVFIRRGACEFGLKSLNGERAGARAIVIVNNVDGNPPGMAAWTFGGDVTVPVFSLTRQDGEAIIAAIEAGERVEITVYPAAFTVRWGYFPPDYTSAPTCVVRDVIDSMGVQVINRSGQVLEDVVVRYRFWDRSSGNVLAMDSIELNSVGVGDTINAQWDLSSSPIDILSLNLSNDMEFEYIAYYKGDPLDPPGTYKIAHRFNPNSSVWAHENTVEIAFRPGSGSDHYDAALFFVPGNVVFEKFRLDKISFIATTNADYDLAGRDVQVLFCKIISEEFDFTKDIFDPTQFELIGFGDFRYTDNSQRFLRVEVPIEDFESGEPGVDIEPGFEYIAVVGYTGPSAPLFHGYSTVLTDPADVENPRVGSLVYADGTGGFRWRYYVDNDRIVSNSIRLHLDIDGCDLVSTQDELLPDDKISIFPNPTSDWINIKMDLETPTDVSVILVDMSGKVIKWNTFRGVMQDNLTFDVSDVNSGVYMLHFTSKIGQRVEKVVIMK